MEARHRSVVLFSFSEVEGTIKGEMKKKTKDN
jgi:hypothetical protein